MSASDFKMSPGFSNPDQNKDQASDPQFLDQLIRDIGIARFSARISAGIINEDAGYKVISKLVEEDERRPLFSRLGQALLGRPNSYQNND